MNPAVPTFIAGYPVREVVVPCGTLAVRMLTVDRLEEHIDRDELLRDEDAPEPPYWAHLWPGSRVLARLVATEINCEGRRLIELGSGLGLVGIAAAVRGAAATLVDSAWPALRFAQASAAVNACTVYPVQTDIGRAGLHGPFDYCVAADVTYDPVLQRALADFIAHHLAPAGRAWCAESVRTFDQGLRESCERHHLHVTEHDTRELDEGRPTIVRITEVTRRT